MRKRVAYIIVAAVVLIWLPFAVLDTHAPPSDQEMIALFERHRDVFGRLEASIKKVGDRLWLDASDDRVAGLLGGLGVTVLPNGLRDVGQVRLLVDSSGILGEGWTRQFLYRRTPQPTDTVDLAEDAAEKVAALQCRRPLPERHAALCGRPLRVNDLDAFHRHAEKFRTEWSAERPLDEHWSLVLTYAD